MLPEMERRRVATEQTLARYRGKSFDWSTGIHCMAMARAHMKFMGHKPPTLPRIRSALAAKRALKERKFQSVTALLDSMFPRIAPAQMALGDLAVVPGEAGIDAVFVCANRDALFGWKEGVEGFIGLRVSLNEVTAAWRL